ncbi:MAG TPA: L,D-transpeptidase family protein [Bacteroidales bacterium]|nr:L,D-transpeptidase family protein [Bacteroidales bacterium]HPI86001.1 L,D-transpeptidase family protein [Bacteroidales bacterium]HPM91701.1 L,D-transpeptidase family protein [Bacteroidales bacterium]
MKTLVSLILLTFLTATLTPVHSRDVPDAIKSKLEQLAVDKDLKIAGEKIHSIEYITNLYQKNDYHPFWNKPEYILDAISGIRDSYNDGLLPGDYHLIAITTLQSELTSPRGQTLPGPDQFADLDLLLTDGIIFLANHLLRGKIDPVSLLPTWNYGYAPIPDLNALTLKGHITAREIPARLKELRPDMNLYDSLLTALEKYRRIAAQGGWPAIAGGGKIEPGATDSRIPAIRNRLRLTGELTLRDSISSAKYDEPLEQDIKAFQASHGQFVDGIIGAGTFRELNVPVEKRIESIRINLERVRWVAGNMPRKYILVNIAAFWLMMVDSNQVVHYTPVVVGKSLSKTPVFRDKMRYIEFNPTWTQPRSIVKNETIPKLKKDSTYLEKNHMVLLDSKGNLIETSSLDFKNLSPSKFPYIVRQEPGPWNSLGEMKFMFPNEYDIYLHDTPSKSLFSRASRAYSHGCIRVKNPVDLAVKLLETTDHDRKKIMEILKTHETTRVNLPEPLDILLLYWTCGIDRNNRLFFVPDIYERDADVLRELDQVMR